MKDYLKRTHTRELLSERVLRDRIRTKDSLGRSSLTMITKILRFLPPSDERSTIVTLRLVTITKRSSG